MTVHCPHCLTGYLLPEHLLGGAGARVRCPGCEGVFVVLPEGEAVGETEEAGQASGDSVITQATSDAMSGGGAGARATDLERPSDPASTAGSPEPAGTAATSGAAGASARISAEATSFTPLGPQATGLAEAKAGATASSATGGAGGSARSGLTQTADSPDGVA